MKIRNVRTDETIDLQRDITISHPHWVHQQCCTTSEAELQHMLDQINLGAYVGQEPDNNGIFIPTPIGAIAWKYADPTEDARWIYDESELAAIRREDPTLIVSLI